MAAEVIVIGGGVAGMAAAQNLASGGVGVTILEARPWLGGRIRAARSESGRFPIELGAEFVHGAKNAVWEVISAAKLKTSEVPARHWTFRDNILKEDNDLFGEIEEVFSGINVSEPDNDFRTFLKKCNELREPVKSLSLDYVEGFHAADPARVSVHSLARSEQASERDDGTRQFRIDEGYRAMLDWFSTRLRQSGVRVELERVVESIVWEEGAVQVRARTESSIEQFEGRQALITLPIGVLQQERSGVQFLPRLPQHEQAIQALAMGPVTKLILEFRTPFWPERNFGFIHALGARFPTWWSDERGAVLTAWAGGPRAKDLEGLRLEELQAEALSQAA